MDPSVDPGSGTGLRLDVMEKDKGPTGSVESASVASDEIVLVPTPSADPNDPLN